MAKWVSAYMEAWEIYVDDLEGDEQGGNWGSIPYHKIDWSHFTHLIMFALAVKSDGVIELGTTYENFSEVRVDRILKQRDIYRKPVLFSIGGAGNTGFQTALGSATSRTQMVNSIVTLIKERGFDGVDLNYEQSMNSTTANQFNDFLGELYDALQGIYMGGTGTVSGWPAIVSSPIVVSAVLPAVPTVWATMLRDNEDKFDQLNVMTYDLSGPWEGWWLWHQSAIYSGNYNPDTGETEGPRLGHPSTGADIPSHDRVFDHLFNDKVPGATPSKWAHGLPLYGRIIARNKGVGDEPAYADEWIHPYTGPDPEGFTSSEEMMWIRAGLDGHPNRDYWRLIGLQEQLNILNNASSQVNESAGANWLPIHSDDPLAIYDKKPDPDDPEKEVIDLANPNPLTGGDRFAFIDWNGPDSIKYARSFCDKLGLGGLIIYAYGNDYMEGATIEFPVSEAIKDFYLEGDAGKIIDTPTSSISLLLANTTKVEVMIDSYPSGAISHNVYRSQDPDSFGKMIKANIDPSIGFIDSDVEPNEVYYYTLVSRMS